MADITTLTAARADEILGMSVVSGTVNPGTGHLILTRGNGQTIDAGDFSAIMTSLMQEIVNGAVQTEVYNRVSGTLFAKGNISGAVSFAEITAVTLVNALITANLTGNITINAADLPSGAKPGTQFAMRLTQANVAGPATLTLTGFKKSQGVLTLSTANGAIDIVVFMYDGTNWYAGMMGVDFK